MLDCGGGEVMAASKEFSGKLGDEFPNIEAPSTYGDLNLHEYWGHGWGERLQPPRTLPACAALL